MAITPTAVRRNDVFGNLKVTVTDILCDTSYPTGGYTVTPDNLGLRGVLFGVVQIKTTAALGNAVDGALVVTDPVTVKLKLNAAAAEVANTTNVSTLVATVVAFGY